jgi:hypothetical protein
MPPPKAAVAVMEAAVMAVVATAVGITAVVMVAHISVVVGILAAMRTSAVVGATPSTT